MPRRCVRRLGWMRASCSITATQALHRGGSAFGRPPSPDPTDGAGPDVADPRECDGRQIYEGRDRAGVLTFRSCFHRAARRVYHPRAGSRLFGFVGRSEAAGRMEWFAGRCRCRSFANRTDQLSLRSSGHYGPISPPGRSGRSMSTSVGTDHRYVSLRCLGRAQPASRGAADQPVVSRLTDYIDAHLVGEISRPILRDET